MMIGLACTFFASCEKDLPINSDPESRLAFVYEYTEDSVVTSTFAYYSEDVVYDTVWLDITLYGMPVDYERPIALEQVMTGQNDAVSGVHYVPFDDPDLVANYYVFPANALSSKIPFVVKRDPSLKTADYKLKITFKPNEAFGYSVKERSTRSILIADQLVKPNNWDYSINYFFGDYGKEKHRFLSQVFEANWDEEYIENEILSHMSDQIVIMGMVRKAGQALADLNAEREAAGLEPLKEEDGTVVTIPNM